MAKGGGIGDAGQAAEQPLSGTQAAEATLSGQGSPEQAGGLLERRGRPHAPLQQGYVERAAAQKRSLRVRSEAAVRSARAREQAHSAPRPGSGKKWCKRSRRVGLHIHCICTACAHARLPLVAKPAILTIVGELYLLCRLPLVAKPRLEQLALH